jgi:hypothetical protein
LLRIAAQWDRLAEHKGGKESEQAAVVLLLAGNSPQMIDRRRVLY